MAKNWKKDAEVRVKEKRNSGKKRNGNRWKSVGRRRIWIMQINVRDKLGRDKLPSKVILSKGKRNMGPLGDLMRSRRVHLICAINTAVLKMPTW